MHGTQVTLEAADPYFTVGAQLEWRGETLSVVGVELYLTGGEFALGFTLEQGERVRLGMSSEQLATLGKMLIQLGEQRRWADGRTTD
jgi:hypothetical protein